MRDCKALARKFANKDSRSDGSAIKSTSSEKLEEGMKCKMSSKLASHGVPHLA